MNSDLVCSLEKTQEMKGSVVYMNRFESTGIVPPGVSSATVFLSSPFVKSLFQLCAGCDRPTSHHLKPFVWKARPEQLESTWQWTKSTENIHNDTYCWSESIFNTTLIAFLCLPQVSLWNMLKFNKLRKFKKNEVPRPQTNVTDPLCQFTLWVNQCSSEMDYFSLFDQNVIVSSFDVRWTETRPYQNWTS